MDLFSNMTLVVANLETGKHVECPADVEVDSVGGKVWVSYHLPNRSVLGLALSPAEARELALELAAVANEAQDIKDTTVYLANVDDDGVVLMDSEPVN